MRRSLVVALVIGTSAVAAQQPPALDAVLARAGTHVGRYAEVMSHLVAEERYVQDLVPEQPRVTTYNYGAVQQVPSGAQHRELRSEMALMKTGPGPLWSMYRDVFEVDRRRVRERDNRLTRTILQPAGSAREQADRIAQEGARFNLGGVVRWMNEPGLPLLFLLPAVQPGCVFTLEGKDGDVWIVRFEERARPTLLRHNSENNPASGRFWIKPATGEIMRAELIVSPSGLKGTFGTTFRHDNRYGIAMPLEMREHMTEGVEAGARRIETVAKYSNYKTFGVKSGWRPQ